MAYKIDTNVMVLAPKFTKGMTVEQLMNWAQAALGNVQKGDDKDTGLGSFPDYVKYNWLSGQVMNVSSPVEGGNNNSWFHFKKRGWHHRDAVKPWTRKRNGKVNTRIGLYSPDMKGKSLNYIAKNLKATGNGKFMQKAWNKFKGPIRSKEELNWMFEHGMQKMFDEVNNGKQA